MAKFSYGRAQPSSPLGRSGFTIIIEVDDAMSQANRALTYMFKDVATQMEKGAEAVANAVHAAIYKNIVQTGPTPDEYRRLGYPFRRGGPRTPPENRSGEPAPVFNHKPEYRVYQSQSEHRSHKGNGPDSLIAGLGIEKVFKGSTVTYYVGIDPLVAEHVRHIIYGTRAMVARDFIRESFREGGVEKGSDHYFKHFQTGMKSFKFGRKTMESGQFDLIDLDYFNN